MSVLGTSSLVLPSVSRAERCRKSRNNFHFLEECRMSLTVIPPSRRVLYREFVEHVVKDPFCGSISMSRTEWCSFLPWVPAENYLSNPEFPIIWRFIRNSASQWRSLQSRMGGFARLSPVWRWFRGNGFLRIVLRGTRSGTTSVSWQLV